MEEENGKTHLIILQFHLLNLKEFTRKTREKEQENIVLRVVIGIMVLIRMMREVVTVKCFGQMAQYIKELGKMVINRE